MNRKTLARMIDHTILKPEATEAEVRKTVEEAIEWGFASVCVNGRWVTLVNNMLQNARAHSPVGTIFPVACAVVGFPFGTQTSSVKTFETDDCVRNGAKEIDMVVCLPDLIARSQNVKEDILRIVQAARYYDSRVVIKVILETAILTDSQIQFGCKMARGAGANFVKTSTGFHPKGGATEDSVRCLKKYGPGLRVKASGGIRDLATAERMIAAGADRLGCSNSVAIVSAVDET